MQWGLSKSDPITRRIDFSSCVHVCVAMDAKLCSTAVATAACAAIGAVVESNVENKLAVVNCGGLGRLIGVYAYAVLFTCAHTTVFTCAHLCARTPQSCERIT